MYIPIEKKYKIKRSLLRGSKIDKIQVMAGDKYQDKDYKLLTDSERSKIYRLDPSIYRYILTLTKGEYLVANDRRMKLLKSKGKPKVKVKPNKKYNGTWVRDMEDGEIYISGMTIPEIDNYNKYIAIEPRDKIEVIGTVDKMGYDVFADSEEDNRPQSLIPEDKYFEKLAEDFEISIDKARIYWMNEFQSMVGKPLSTLERRSEDLKKADPDTRCKINCVRYLINNNPEYIRNNMDKNKFASAVRRSNRIKKSYSDLVTNDSEFKSWIHNFMKKAHGDNYSKEVTEKVANDLISKYGKDYGAMIGAAKSFLYNSRKGFSMLGYNVLNLSDIFSLLITIRTMCDLLAINTSDNRFVELSSRISNAISFITNERNIELDYNTLIEDLDKCSSLTNYEEISNTLDNILDTLDNTKIGDDLTTVYYIMTEN